jgi:hypothetical protein
MMGFVPTAGPPVGQDKQGEDRPAERSKRFRCEKWRGGYGGIRVNEAGMRGKGDAKTI